jgi:NAD-dependent deacetylase
MNLTRFKSLVILTGAGISAESGIPTFRASDGLWESHRIEDVATPQAFQRNPNLVHEFYNQRRKNVLAAQANAAHQALARLEAEWEGPFLLVTQNVDHLHEQAGSKQILHMHGSLMSALCVSCESRSKWLEDLSVNSTCSVCSKPGFLRPDIVWFGEVPYYLDEIHERLNSCEIFISIGTSGVVYPASQFASQAWLAHRIEVNLELSAVAAKFHDHRRGFATTEVPRLVDELLSK